MWLDTLSIAMDPSHINHAPAQKDMEKRTAKLEIMSLQYDLYIQHHATFEELSQFLQFKREVIRSQERANFERLEATRL